MKQTIIWTAVPNGIGKNSSQLKVSVRASIRLQTSSKIAVLQDFPDFSGNSNGPIRNWCHKNIGFQVQFGRGDTVHPEWSSTVEASWNDQRDPDLWNAILPSDKQVVSFQMPAYQDCRFRSFPAGDILAYITDVYSEIGSQAPDDFPSIDDLVGQNEAGYGLIGGLAACSFPGNEARITKGWDKGPKTKPGLTIFDHFYQTQKFHQFRGNANKPLLTKPELDFHRTVAVLENYPLILNKMGLLFQLTCEIPAGIKAQSSLPQWVRILPHWNPQLPAETGNLRPCTAFFFNPTAACFETAPAPVSDLAHGLLNLASPKYETIQVDVDGSALKLVDFAVNMVRMDSAVSRSIDSPDAAGLPALRSGGISIIRKDRDELLYQKVDRAAQMNVNPDDSLLFYADDLMMGLRIDVLDQKTGSWRSLCKRIESYSVRKSNGSGYDPLESNLPGEGLIKTAIMKDPDNEQDLYLHEALSHWDGWSLAVSRPGQAVINPPADDSGTAHNYTGESSPEIDPSVGLKVDMEPAMGTLPRLRYGRNYRLRARVVDIAGNSLPLGTDGNPGCSTPALVYHRYEPINAPALAADKSFPSPASPGESMDRLVIRSAAGGKSGNSIRYVAPPRVSQQMAEFHGLFDQPCPDATKNWFQVLCERHGEQAHLPERLDQPINDVPYLPDPLAGSVALKGFPGQSEAVFVEVAEGVAWPSAQPFRICLGAGNFEVNWDAGQRILHLLIPPAELVKLRISSRPSSEENLELLGVWEWITEKAGPHRREALKKLALSGGHWMLTPSRELTLIHAVPKPLTPPAFDNFTAAKQQGQTWVDLSGLIKVHGKSTGKVDVYADWKDRIDNPDSEGTGNDWSAPKSGHPFFILNSSPPVDGLDCGGRRHDFGDTKYRQVTYRAVAASSFREYFSEGEDVTLEGDNAITVDILNSSRPAVPEIEYLIPTFGWEKAVQPDGSSSRRTGGGIRVYLKRPWFSSGDGELLGVLIAQGPADNSATHVLPGALKNYVTQWGFDPIWLSAPPFQAPTVHHFPLGIAQESGVTIDEAETLPSNPDSWWLSVVGHQVEFDQERQLWFCDLDIEAGPSYYPFVRLALVRYQPRSVRGTQVSRVALADFIQLTPERLAWVTSLPNEPYLVEVSVSGPSAWKNSTNNCANVMAARLETLHPEDTEGKTWLPVTPGWQAMVRTQNTAAVTVWSGLVNLPAPRGSRRFRVVIQEYEIWGAAEAELDSDKLLAVIIGARKTGRLVYSDTIEV